VKAGLLAALLALGAERDVHTLANLDAVRPVHLSLDLTLDFEARRIRGTNELTLAYVGERAPAHVDLDTRELTIRGVSEADGGRELRFELGPPVEFLGRRLRVHLEGRRPAKLRVEYETSPSASALQWLEPRQTSGRLPFLLTQSQAIHARSFIPCADSPGARVSYDATVRVPAGMQAVMSAEHGPRDEQRGVFRFRLDQPVPPYLIALAAGELAFRELGPRTGVYAEPARLEAAASEFRDVERMMEIAERLYGRYRWGRWDTVVLPPSFPYGGMENPRLTFATPTLIAGDRSLVSVMAHELAHSWSGNLVTNASWGDFWLNEGFTSYIENRIVEELFGADLAALERILAQQELRQEVARLESTHPADTALVLDLEGRDPDEGTTAVAYQKGANLLFLLEQHFGRARFDAFLRGYFDAHAFTSMTSARFLEILRRELFPPDGNAWSRLRVEEWGVPPRHPLQHGGARVAGLPRGEGGGPGLRGRRRAARGRDALADGRVAAVPERAAADALGLPDGGPRRPLRPHARRQLGDPERVAREGDPGRLRGRRPGRGGVPDADGPPQVPAPPVHRASREPAHPRAGADDLPQGATGLPPDRVGDGGRDPAMDPVTRGRSAAANEA
jgi:aminopeptidase N